MAAIHIANMPHVPRDDMDRACRYPLSFAGSMLECTTVFGDPGPVRVPEGYEFQSCVKDVFYMKKGENDGDEWVLLGTLVGCGWFYYTVSCDYTGFDCQGGMRCVAASSLGRLVEHGLGDWQRKSFAAQAMTSQHRRKVRFPCNTHPSSFPWLENAHAHMEPKPGARSRAVACSFSSYGGS